MVDCWSHNPTAVGSNPTPASIIFIGVNKLENTIFNEDCIKTIERNNFNQDYVITGQPDFHELDLNPKKTKDLEKYFSFTDKIYEQLQNKINLISLIFTDRKQNGGIIQKSSHNIELFTNKLGFKLKTYKIWHKQEVPTINMFRLNYSHILTFCKNDKLVPKNNIKEFRYDIFNIKHKQIDGFSHGFPEEIINLLIKKYSNEGQIIYDPFMGSGTAQIQAIKNNRKYIGSELSKETYEIQLKRIFDLTKE